MRLQGKACSISVCFLLTSSAVDVVASDSSEQYFQQAFDHFDLLNKIQFNQRFFIDTTYWKPGGPLFYTPGGEAELSSLPYHLGFELAKKYSGAYAALEHRFYGKSIPINGKVEKAFSRYPGMLGKLTIEQAVADSAAFILHVKESILNATNHVYDLKVFALGGSYSGKLAAYLRYSHPHVCDAALASSAPVLLDGTDLGVNQYAYYETVTRAAEKTIPGCAKAVRQALGNLQKISLQELSSTLPLCESLEKEEEREELIQLVRIFFANAAMSNYPPNTETDMWKLCKALSSAPTTISAWREFFNISDSCLNLKDFVAGVHCRGAKIACGDFSGCGFGWAGEAWDYQSTTQVIQPIGTNNVTDMFPPRPFSLGWMEEHSAAHFNGAVVDSHGLAERYGLRKVKSLYTKVIWTNGLMDPWSVGGVYGTKLSFVLPNGAHHSELSAPRSDDTPDIVVVRGKIMELVSALLDLPINFDQELPFLVAEK